MRRREGHVGQHVGLGVVEEAGEFGQLGPQLFGHPSPLGACLVGVVLGKAGGDEGRDHPPAALAGVGQDVAHEGNAAALPGTVHDLGDCRLDALVAVGDHQLDAPQGAPGEFAQELGPEGLRFGRPDIQAQDLARAKRASVAGDGLWLAPAAAGAMHP
jgi:hypothetical protein